MLKERLFNDEFKITFTSIFLDLENVKKILLLKNNNIEVLVKNYIISISGDNLIISKLFDDEILIKGNIKVIEKREND